jgi:hypothetical protein
MYIVVNGKRIDIVDFKQTFEEIPEQTKENYDILEIPEQTPEIKENYDSYTSLFSDPLVIAAIVLVVILIGFFLYIYFYEIKETEVPPLYEEKFIAPGPDINIQPKTEFDQIMETVSVPSTPEISSEILPFQKLRIPEIEKTYEEIVPTRTTKIQLGSDVVPPPPVYVIQESRPAQQKEAETNLFEKSTSLFEKPLFENIFGKTFEAPVSVPKQRTTKRASEKRHTTTRQSSNKQQTRQTKRKTMSPLLLI